MFKNSLAPLPEAFQELYSEWETCNQLPYESMRKNAKLGLAKKYALFAARSRNLEMLQWISNGLMTLNLQPVDNEEIEKIISVVFEIAVKHFYCNILFWLIGEYPNKIKTLLADEYRFTLYILNIITSALDITTPTDEENTVTEDLKGLLLKLFELRETRLKSVIYISNIMYKIKSNGFSNNTQYLPYDVLYPLWMNADKKAFDFALEKYKHFIFLQSIEQGDEDTLRWFYTQKKDLFGNMISNKNEVFIQSLSQAINNKHWNILQYINEIKIKFSIQNFLSALLSYRESDPLNQINTQKMIFDELINQVTIDSFDELYSIFSVFLPRSNLVLCTFRKNEKISKSYLKRISNLYNGAHLLLRNLTDLFSKKYQYFIWDPEKNNLQSLDPSVLGADIEVHILSGFTEDEWKKNSQYNYFKQANIFNKITDTITLLHCRYIFRLLKTSGHIIQYVNDQTLLDIFSKLYAKFLEKNSELPLISEKTWLSVLTVFSDDENNMEKVFNLIKDRCHIRPAILFKNPLNDLSEKLQRNILGNCIENLEKNSLQLSAEALLLILNVLSKDNFHFKNNDWLEYFKKLNLYVHWEKQDFLVNDNGVSTVEKIIRIFEPRLEQQNVFKQIKEKVINSGLEKLEYENLLTHTEIVLFSDPNSASLEEICEKFSSTSLTN